ncbi:hypothetical protein C4544_00895 [candidate division WS5 bacterium]|uniref:Uncharacterized protein n=1 Tax=candidate division WS5 bacterium TaxID=2093353 RepID=A0A419DG34_9BACT|nr:MAG: hypothetical protein C4544_00895 [candidate division WS5 bacterium]
MKKILGNKTAIILVLALLAGFGGTFAYLSMTDSSKKEEEKKDDTKEDGKIQNEKGEGLPIQEDSPKKQEPVQEGAPTGSSTNLSSLSSSVTAQKNPSDGSIEVLFYLEGSGSFTSQEKSGDAWITVKENQSYAGRGGFLAGTISSGQESKTMRVLKIESGKYSTATKEFTIKRSEVEAALGIKTYN